VPVAWAAPAVVWCALAGPPIAGPVLVEPAQDAHGNYLTDDTVLENGLLGCAFWREGQPDPTWLRPSGPRGGAYQPLPMPVATSTLPVAYTVACYNRLGWGQKSNCYLGLRVVP